MGPLRDAVPGPRPVDAGVSGGTEVGAITYNAAHTYVGPAVLVGLALWAGADGAVAIAVIWIAHIGVDRVLGFGLKLDRGFGYTHLGSIGKAPG